MTLLNWYSKSNLCSNRTRQHLIMSSCCSPDDSTADDAAASLAAAPANKSTSRISTFLRVRPTTRPTARIVLEPLDGTVEFNVPRDAAAGPVNNSRERYCFSFDGILTPEAKQDEVFERVVRPVVATTLEGYNGTVFAYGQTGSGKTFTITGGAERYVDRGVIPRTISSIFKHVADAKAGYTYQVFISYLEIYNEVGYDLLDPSREVKAMEDLPQVTIQEDEEQNIHFRNLSVHRAATEEEALNLLFLGDTNRTISETPMNQASSRSHCIFVIGLEARKAGSDVVRHSKLHLVDLAGSERVAKTGVDGNTLKEAKYINLSLHYLEQVIVALQERSMGLARVHVPYRNSLMTLVLRDSLGGNCKTVMVATVSGEAAQMEESISTCRFAQRVAMVTNEVSVNESVDPVVVIARLKQEVRDLKEEIALLKGNAPQRGPLTPDELQRLRQQLLAYVDEGQPGAAAEGSSGGTGLNFGGDMMMIRASWLVFKQLILEYRAAGGHGVPASAASAPVSNTSTQAGSQQGPDGQVQALQDQLRKLRLQVQQRDNEIALLVNMLKGRGPSAALGAPPAGTVSSSSSNSGTRPGGKGTAAAEAADTASTSDAGGRGAGADADAAAPPVLSALLDASLLSDRHKAFDVFRQSYRQGQVIDDHKLLLKAKYEQAKALGQAVNASKAHINEAKASIELWRAQRAAACVAEGRDPSSELTQEDPREQEAKLLIEQEKLNYKAAFSQLRSLKGEIEHLHLLLEQSRKKLQQDFQQWLAMVARQQQEQQQQQQQIAPASEAPDAASTSSRPSTARQYGRSVSSSTAAAAAGKQTSLQQGQQEPGMLTGRPGSAGRGVLRKAISAMPAGTAAAAAAAAAVGSSALSTAVRASLDLSRVDVKLLQAAGPHLTGNPEADADIIRFYEAKEKLLQLKLGARA